MEKNNKPRNYLEIMENDDDIMRLHMVDGDDSEDFTYTPSIGFIRTVDADGNASYIQCQSLLYDDYLDSIRKNPSLSTEDDSTD